MRTAAVVGGGIGGLATAVALLRRGWRVRVFEQSPGFEEVGAGISLWANAMAALDSIGLGDPVRAAGASPGLGGFRDHRGRWLARGAGTVDELLILHRADLLAVLLDAVPDECLAPGTRVDSPRVEGGRVVVGEEEVDLLVGADGLRSAVRAAFWPEAAAPEYGGRTAWRMVLPSTGIAPFDGSETWGGGLVFGAFPLGPDRLYCYAAATTPPGGAHPGGELAGVRALFAGWPEPIPSVLAAASEADVLRHDLFHLPPLRSYARGPVALVGDAAHAMLPSLGQGACQALEDAVSLAAHACAPDLQAGLRRYDAERRPRSQGIARRSRAAAAVAHLSARPAVALRDLALRVTPTPLFRRSLRGITAWRPPA